MPRVSVTDSATLIIQADADGTSGSLKNAGAAAIDVEINDATVTSGAGFELESGDILNFELRPGSTIHGIAASGTVSVHVLRDDG